MRTQLLGVCALLLLLAVNIASGRPTSRVDIVGSPGAHELRVNGAPFYVRGVSYPLNEDPLHPEPVLIRARVRGHFRQIRQAGGNTIRRYHDNDDTRMILDEASRAGLMVLMGYWLDHDVDYLTDARRLSLYRQRVGEWVLRYRRHPAVLMWVLGNETWGLLKREFPAPEDLWPRRAAYYTFVDELARLTKSLDPSHPVMTVDEHVPGENARDLQGHRGIEQSLAMFRDRAPAVDVFGVNSYYPEDISRLDQVVATSGIRQPYMVTEFGPPGYWPWHHTLDDLGQPVEPSDLQKAGAYYMNWMRYILPFRGRNLGGNAFAWRDRYEGSFTWFGLTDSEGRLKPAYWTLRQAWIGRGVPRDRPMVVELAINKRWMKPEESFVVSTHVLPSLDPAAFRYTYLIGPASMTHIETQFTTDLPVVSLHAPGTPGVYRVYVYVTSRDNTAVSTASVSLAVYDPGRGAPPAAPPARPAPSR